MATINTKVKFKTFHKSGNIPNVSFSANNNTIVTDSLGEKTINLETENSGTGGNLLHIEITNMSTVENYFCSYINNVNEWNYGVGTKNPINISCVAGSDVTIPLFFVPKDFRDTTLMPRIELIKPEGDAAYLNGAYITYQTYKTVPTMSFPLEWNNSTTYPLLIPEHNGITYLRSCRPNDWTSLDSTKKIITTNIEYGSPFRITSDSGGNNIIATTNIESQTSYKATWTITPEPNKPYYQKDGEVSAYFATNPYLYQINILFTDNPFVIIPKNTNFTIKYIDSDHPDSTNPQSIKFPYDGNAKGIVPTSILTSYIKFKIIDIYAIGSNNEPYFCAYLNHINETHRHFWYDKEGIFGTTLNDAKTTVTKNTTTNVFLIMCPKNNDCTQISPHISTPVEPSNVSVKYLYISDSLTKNTDYQYSTTKTESFIKVGSSNTQMGSWARYGFNVHNEDYTLELQSPKTTDLTQDYDLYLNNSLIKPTSEENNIRKYTFKSLEKNNYEYFTDSPKFTVLPKTHIEYVIDSSVITNGCGLKIDLSDGTQTKRYSIDSSTPKIITDISGNEKSNIKQTLQLTGSTVNPITSVQVKYNGLTYNYNNTIIYDQFISNSAISMPNTWNNVGITYTISLQTRKPAVIEQQAQFGLQINTSGVENKLNYTLNIDDSNLKFVGVNTKEEDTNKHSKIYNDIVGNTSGNILLIDGDQTSKNTLNFNLYLGDDSTSISYCVNNRDLQITFYNQNNQIYQKYAVLNLNNYIEENEFYRGKNQIKLSKIEVPYIINMSIMDTTNNTTVLPTITCTVENTYTFDIEDKYSDDKKYSLVVNNIKATIDGNSVELPRYNFNLVEGSEQISYLKNPPITFTTNELVNDVIMKDIFNINNTLIGGQIILPAGITNSNIYFNSYINGITLESKQNMHVTVKSNDNEIIEVPNDNPIYITLSPKKFIKKLTISTVHP